MRQTQSPRTKGSAGSVFVFGRSRRARPGDGNLVFIRRPSQLKGRARSDRARSGSPKRSHPTNAKSPRTEVRGLRCCVRPRSKRMRPASKSKSIGPVRRVNCQRRGVPEAGFEPAHLAVCACGAHASTSFAIRARSRKTTKPSDTAEQATSSLPRRQHNRVGGDAHHRFIANSIEQTRRLARDAIAR